MFSLPSSIWGSTPEPAAPVAPTGKPVTLLVIQADAYDWPEIFVKSTLRDGRSVNVVQAGWDDLHVHADTYCGEYRVCVEVRKLAKTASGAEGSNAPREFGAPRLQTIRPDFVLVRNEVLTPSFDGRTRLGGLMFADVPSVNSLLSISMACDRAAVMGYLHRLNRQMGDDFRVVPQHFASSHRSLMYGYDDTVLFTAPHTNTRQYMSNPQPQRCRYTFPAVVKVGSAHAGAGKMQISDHHQMSDFRSVRPLPCAGFTSASSLPTRPATRAGAGDDAQQPLLRRAFHQRRVRLAHPKDREALARLPAHQRVRWACPAHYHQTGLGV